MRALPQERLLLFFEGRGGRDHSFQTMPLFKTC